MHNLQRIVALAVLLAASWCYAEEAGPGRFENEPPAGTEIVYPGDGALMVWVPAGEFTMGINADRAVELAKQLGYEDYHKFAAEEWFPQRQVYVNGFFIDKYEVTVELWKKFVAASSYQTPDPRVKWPTPKNEGEFDLQPVVRISWAEAQKYVNYYGKALPLERQWEKAARGTDARMYPWGNEPPNPELGAFTPDIMGTKTTTALPVGSKPKGASPYGCMDMSGNVYEWTCEWHEPYPNNPERDRIIGYMGHENGCLRGGSFYHAAHALPAPKRFGFPPSQTYYHVGFRAVWEPPAGWFKTDEYKKARADVDAAEKHIDELRAKAQPIPQNF